MIFPSQLVANCQKTPERRDWLQALPELLDRLLALWSLRLDLPFDQNGTCSLVCPVLRADGMQAVLKIAMPHMEGKQEIQALRHWNGRSMVRLLEADEGSGSMLLERCVPGTPLRSEPELTQDVIIAKLLGRIWESTEPSALSEFRHLSEMIDFWSDETMAQRDHWSDPGLVREGLRVINELARSAPTDVLLATDLHAGNVLRAQTEPWLAIDPKPFVGDRAYDPVQHVINCETRLHNDPHSLVKRIAEMCEVDSERLRLWTFARAAADPREDWTNTRWMDIAKALSP